MPASFLAPWNEPHVARVGSSKAATGNFPLLASQYKEDFQASGGFMMLCLEVVNSTVYIRHKDSERDYMALNSGMV